MYLRPFKTCIPVIKSFQIIRKLGCKPLNPHQHFHYFPTNPQNILHISKATAFCIAEVSTEKGRKENRTKFTTFLHTTFLWVNCDQHGFKHVYN